MEEKNVIKMLLCSSMVVFLSMVAAQAEPPVGRMYLEEVFVDKSIAEQMGNSKGPTLKNFLLTCSTPSRASRTALEDITLQKKKVFEEPLDLTMEIVSVEEMECELREALSSAEQQILSHGTCSYTYARFLASENNSVSCNLAGGSSFRVKMECEGGCPKKPEVTNEKYCSGLITFPSASAGITNSFGDGSPGFTMYAPNSECRWMVPRSEKRITNFFFTRFDLGDGDTIEVYAYVDEGRKQLIRTYTKNSSPESVWVDAPYMLIEFKSDESDEGFGFFGFYFDTFNKQDAVSVIPENVEEDKEAVGSDEKVEGVIFEEEPTVVVQSTIDEPESVAQGPTDETEEEKIEDFTREPSKKRRGRKTKEGK